MKSFGAFCFLIAFGVFLLTLCLGRYQLTDASLRQAVTKPWHLDMIRQATRDMQGKTYSSQFAFVHDLQKALEKARTELDRRATVVNYQATTLPEGVAEWDFRIGDTKDYRLYITKYATSGYLTDYAPWWFALSFLLGAVGGLIYHLPRLRRLPGIQNDYIFNRSLLARGWLGIATAVFLILFYIVLYWFPEYIANWMILLDPLSKALNGGGASQWFLYGFLYTVCMLVMGVRMMLKYRHNRYQLLRTGSVIFFQTIFAFLIPEILVRLNYPYYDFKNMWPLKYDFFFEWHLDKLINSGRLGVFMLVWGIALFSIAVPVLTYFFGKRWYCSWVCGCGGLAETLGDPFRQLSDKSLRAWKIERYLIHGVLVFAVIMTALVLYSYFTGKSNIGFLSSYDIRSWYGFAIGSAFAGVVGTGFYPLMGNRVWCRFGCPLAAYLGLVQKFRSRFRITVNGGQCISCGNCSTYCEMGIDVRAYAQRGQDIVRSSCVGCGICAAVCPRGVLRLENASADIGSRTQQTRAIHVKLEDVGILS